MNHLSETLLNAYLDNALEGTERTQVETHLAGCSYCQARLQDLQLVFDSLAALPDVELEWNLAPDILSQLPQASPSFTGARGIAVQWGVVLGVSIWSAMQVVKTIKLPSPEALMKFMLLDMPVLSISTLQPPSYSLPQLEIPGFSLPVIGLPFTSGQIVTVTLLALLLWVVGNFTLLRKRPQGSS